jgi:hypothetical protein
MIVDVAPIADRVDNNGSFIMEQLVNYPIISFAYFGKARQSSAQAFFGYLVGLLG